MVDKKTFWIGILTLTAAVLVVGNLMNPTPAVGENVIKDRDYQLATAVNSAGGDTLYVTDNRTGMVAVLTFDSGTRGVAVKAVKPISDAFVVRRPGQ